jgi:hypothetical protein
MQTFQTKPSDEEIIASMVKSRECCRRAGKALQEARARAVAGEGLSGIDTVAEANDAITRMLSHLKKVPPKMSSSMSSDSSRAYAARLLLEISELLEKAMIMERETREIVGSLNQRKARGRGARPAAPALTREEVI